MLIVEFLLEESNKVTKAEINVMLVLLAIAVLCAFLVSRKYLLGTGDDSGQGKLSRPG